MSITQRSVEELLTQSEEEIRLVRDKIAQLEALQGQIARRLAGLHLLLGDQAQNPPRSAHQMKSPPAKGHKAKRGAREHIIAVLNAAEKPLTRTAIMQRFRAQKLKYLPGTVHLYLQKLIEAGEVVQGDAPAESRSTFTYRLKAREMGAG